MKKNRALVPEIRPAKEHSFSSIAKAKTYKRTAEFQREFVWTQEVKSKLIDSILGSMDKKPLYRNTSTPETKALWDSIDRMAAEAPFWSIIEIEKQLGKHPKVTQIELKLPLLGEPGLYISFTGADISIPGTKNPEKIGHINSSEVKNGKIICKATVRKEFAARIKATLEEKQNDSKS